MNLIELLLIAVGLSMDAFAMAVCAGLTMSQATLKKSAIVATYFGVFQGVMPIIGYFLATLLADNIGAIDHWIAFALLFFIGGKMIAEGLKKEGHEVSLDPLKMLPLAVATSIDALAVGVSFAFLDVDIIQPALSIGVITFVLSMVGVKVGNLFGSKIKSKAEMVGGAVLVLMGFKILLEHLEIFS